MLLVERRGGAVHESWQNQMGQWEKLGTGRGRHFLHYSYILEIKNAIAFAVFLLSTYCSKWSYSLRV